MRLPTLLLAIFGTSLLLHPAHSSELFDHTEIRDPATLDVRVIQDWHDGPGPVPTRQKVVDILVHEVIPGKPYRIPVRFIVPKDQKARGFHLTGGHGLRDFEGDGKVSAVDQVLLEGGVGRVHTIIQELRQSGQGELSDALSAKFIETLDPRYSIQYYGWPLTLMKAITAAHAESDHFEPGKIAMSGASKNGATPSSALNLDDRTTAVHGAVSPIWDSPLRLCDESAWQELDSFNQSYAESARKADPAIKGRLTEHPFLGGTYGPIYNRRALAAGHSWEELKALAEAMADKVFISRNVEQLKARGAEYFFHPGTHDFVCYDLAWGGANHPEIPCYLRANSGHGIKPAHPAASRPEDNLTAFLYQHFFDDFEGRLAPPSVSTELSGDSLKVSVRFPEGSAAESGRIWWLYDRGADGSASYLRERIADENWADMKWDASADAWTVMIPIDTSAATIDLFSNHRKTLNYRGRELSTSISSPYTRVPLQ